MLLSTIPIFNFSKCFNVVIDVEYWRNKNPSFPEDVLVWYTDGSRTDSGTGSGIQGIRPKRGCCFPLGKYATVFQMEIYAILQCAYENIRAYRNKWILIFSDSQAALNGPKVTSRLVAECLDALSALADLTKVTLIWVPGHRGICGNEHADKRQPHPFSVWSRLLEYPSVWQERQSRNGPSIKTLKPGGIRQVADTASFS
jgi:ribonuclease HI